jgi:hypothetical protein
VFEDEQWIVKILLAAAILLLGVLFSWVLAIPLILALALLYGYGVEIMRGVLNGYADKLPEWDDWGQLLADGLKVWLIGFVYALPIIIVSFCLGVPTGILAEDAEELSTLLSLCLSCLSFLYAIVLSVVLPGAIAFWVANDDLSAAFRFGDVFAFVRDNVATYLITFIMSWVANLIGSLGSLVCGIGWLVTAPYALMVTGHLYGQAYVESIAQAPVVVDFEEAPDFEDVVADVEEDPDFEDVVGDEEETE